MRRLADASRLLRCLAFVSALGVLVLEPHRSAAQADRPSVRLIEIATATIDDGKQGYSEKLLTGATIGLDFTAASALLDLNALAVVNPDATSVPAFAYVVRQRDKSVAFTPSAPFQILNLGGTLAQTNAPDIQFSGWDVTIGDAKIATWGNDSIPAVRPGKAGLKVRAFGPGKATLTALFDTARANVELVKILELSLSAK